MSNSDTSQPLFTLSGLEALAADPNVNNAELITELNNLRSLHNQQMLDNQAMAHQLEIQAQALQNHPEGPLVSISATLRAITQAQVDSNRIMSHTMKNEEDRSARTDRLIEQIIARQNNMAGGGRNPIPVPLTPKFKGADGEMTFSVFKAKLESQCQLFPQALATDEARVTYAFQSMDGPPSKYVAAYINHIALDTKGILRNYVLFLNEVDRLFGDQYSKTEIARKLMQLRQGNAPFHEYLVRFKELASRSTWNEEALLEHFKVGLSHEIQSLLAGQWHLLNTMEEAASAATVASQNLKVQSRFGHKYHQSYQQHRRPATVITNGNSAGPMEIDAMSTFKKISPSERQRRLDNRLCLYCGGPNHIASNCPVKKPIHANVIEVDAENFQAEN
jgi:hypothetical protein